jgi:signal transduction histidine kinase
MCGLFVFIWTRPRVRPGRSELRLVESVARHAAIAIDHASLLREVEALNANLERRVEDRTRRLRRAHLQLRRSRAELRAVSRHMERVQETERCRISREIHDELGQALTGLRFELDRLVRDPLPGRTTQLEKLPLAVDAMIETVRRIASELRPAILDDLGLVPAREWRGSEFEATTGITCRLRLEKAVPMLDADQSTALFRILQEILTNVARHARASLVSIRLTASASAVILEARDNGRGTDDLLGKAAHLGLLGMQERAAAVGGTLRVRSAAGRGTMVRVRLPFSRGQVRLPQAS